MFKLEKLPGDISVPKRIRSACFAIVEYKEEILLMMPKTCGAMSKRALTQLYPFRCQFILITLFCQKSLLKLC